MPKNSPAYRPRRGELLLRGTANRASNSVLIGTASLIEHDVPTRAELTPWLASVYVDPRFRKRGIGSALVRAVLQEARNLGLEKLYLITPDQVPFYRRQGWQEMEEIVYRGEAVTIMVYALR